MIDNIIYENIDGAKLAFINKKGYKKKQAMVSFSYGSYDKDIIVDNKNISLPAGIAHFLEHKMFEHREKNAFDIFNNMGASVNAYTNLVSTSYYFDCISNFDNCFNELLDLVSTPYFTKENVEKEKGIIAQEIKMYDDDPYWKVYFNLVSAMYNKNNPITKDIVGSIDDIKKIDYNMLYTCYNNFYTKNNALIVCCGDIEDYDKIKSSIETNLRLNVETLGIVQKYVEKKQEKAKKVNQKMKLNQEIFNIGFKNIQICDKIEKKVISSKLLLDIMCGTSSPFYKNLYESDNIDNSFSLDFQTYRGFSFYTLSGIGSNADNICEMTLNEIKKINLYGIKKETFDRIKNKHIGRFISQFNSIDSIVSMEADFFSKGFCIKKYYDALLNITIKDLEKSISSFDDSPFISTVC